MGRRHNGRRLAMQILYQLDLRDEKTDDVIELGLQGSDSEPETKVLARELAEGAWKIHPELDAELSTQLEHWSVERISRVDHAILRLAVYEIKKSDLAPQIIIDEAVELAKEFSTDESPKFINGVLGAIMGGVQPKARVKVDEELPPATEPETLDHV